MSESPEPWDGSHVTALAIVGIGTASARVTTTTRAGAAIAPGFSPTTTHSLDACLPVLADLREKGWQVSLWSSRSAWHVAMLNPKFPKLNPNPEANDLAAALAGCIAEELEAS